MGGAGGGAGGGTGGDDGGLGAFITSIPSTATRYAGSEKAPVGLRRRRSDSLLATMSDAYGTFIASVVGSAR